MTVPTFVRAIDVPDAAWLVVIDAQGKRVAGPVPLARHGANFAFAHLDLPDDAGPLVALFTRDAEGLDVVSDAPVEDPRPLRDTGRGVVGAWLVREGLRLVAAEPESDTSPPAT